MDSLIEVLSHPYLIINRIAEAMYEDEGNAINQRLRSRIKGRHRFTVEEYNALKKVLLSFSRKLDRIANKMEKAKAKEQTPDWLKLMHNDWLNHKIILIDVGEKFKLDYYGVYDGMRHRKNLPATFIDELIKTYRTYAEWIREQIDQSKVEKKTYKFSFGRGGGSHLEDGK